MILMLRSSRFIKWFLTGSVLLGLAVFAAVTSRPTAASAQTDYAQLEGTVAPIIWPGGLPVYQNPDGGTLQSIGWNCLTSGGSAADLKVVTFEPENCTGTAQLQGSLTGQSDRWYNIGSSGTFSALDGGEATLAQDTGVSNFATYRWSITSLGCDGGSFGGAELCKGHGL